MNCGSCVFFKRLNDAPNQGLCRESPPKAFMVPVRSIQGEGFGFQAIFPQVDAGNWCGSYADVIDHDPIDGDTTLENEDEKPVAS